MPIAADYNDDLLSIAAIFKLDWYTMQDILTYVDLNENDDNNK
jgi:hypothetical protein